MSRAWYLLRAALLGLALVAAVPCAGAPQDEAPNAVLLVARPQMRDPNFAHSVVLATRAGEGTTVGVILNRPTTLTYEGRPLAFGGPVLPASRIALFEADAPPPAASFHVLPNVYLSMHPQVLEALIARRDARLRVYGGFAAWAPGQLQRELDQGAWYVLPADASLLFRETTEGLWEELVARAAAARA